MATQLKKLKNAGGDIGGMEEEETKKQAALEFTQKGKLRRSVRLMVQVPIGMGDGSPQQRALSETALTTTIVREFRRLIDGDFYRPFRTTLAPLNVQNAQFPLLCIFRGLLLRFPLQVVGIDVDRNDRQRTPKGH